MYGLDTTSQISHLDWNHQVDRDVVTVKAALQLHRSACFAGQLAEAWHALTGRNRRLLDLADVRAACPVRNGHYAGMRTVPVCQIREPTEPGHGLQQEEMDTLLTRNRYDRVSSHTQQIPLMSEVCDGVFAPCKAKV